MTQEETGTLTGARNEVSLLDIVLSTETWKVSVGIHVAIVVAVLALFAAIILWRVVFHRRFGELEIDEAEIGIGSGKLKLRPNYADRQVAYQIWVELSTRKIGLPIDLDHDVIDDVYNSWFQFFAVTRDLIKGIPVAKVSDPSTKAIIRLSIEVLNEGLRPHLTLWQARFRSWYEQQLKSGTVYEEPQDIQKRFPRYADLTRDFLLVNSKLIAYRETMYLLVFGKRGKGGLPQAVEPEVSSVQEQEQEKGG